MLFLHGAGEPTAADGSFSLLKRLTEACRICDTRVSAPVLPTPDSPRADEWTAAILKCLQQLETPTTIVAHSLGGSCALNALSMLASLKLVRGLILIATPYWGSDPEWSSRSFILPRSYCDNLQSIDRTVLVYSLHDEVVPIHHMQSYLKDMPWANVVTLSNVNHAFNKGDITRLCDSLKPGFDEA